MESVICKIVARIPRELAVHLEKDDMEVALSGDLTDEDLDSLQNILYYRSLTETTQSSPYVGIDHPSRIPLAHIVQNRKAFSEQTKGIDSEKVHRSMVLEMKPMTVQNRNIKWIQKLYKKVNTANTVNVLAQSMKDMQFNDF